VEQRRLGRSDLEVSVVGLGCNNFGGRVDADETREIVAAALDHGINFFDTADVYGKTRSEQFLGAALAGRREQVIIATKFGGQTGDDETERGASAGYIARAVEASLARLGTDYIDLYQLHFPDETTPIEETLDALDALVRAGKVRFIGCSNFAASQLAAAEAAASAAGGAHFVTAQNHYSLIDRHVEAEILPACERFGISVLPYFPLGSGVLTGKYRRGEPPAKGTRLAKMGARAALALNERNFDLVDALTGFAEARGHTILALAFCWLLSRPSIGSVIAGATSVAQIEANVAAGATWRLSATELAALDAAVAGI
jgi:aryl-alcohol dehydrogenase-like predicted oxidoreductase